jgi:hypothetical protein
MPSIASRTPLGPVAPIHISGPISNGSGPISGAPSEPVGAPGISGPIQGGSSLPPITGITRPVPALSPFLRCPLPTLTNPSADNLRQFYRGEAMPQYRFPALATIS